MWEFPQYKNYRKSQNVLAASWFKQNNFLTQDKYPFILKNKTQWRNNIILSEVADFIEVKKIESEKSKTPFPLHKYIHHGLSSQAMLFNLLGDSVLKNDYSFFSRLFDYNDISITTDSKYQFEYSDRKIFNEKQRQPTSFDFAIENKVGKNIYVEAKYVETEFGKCSTIDRGECDGLNPIKNQNRCYLKHQGRNYWQLMEKYKLNKVFHESPICPFTIYYQFYRELMFALENNGYYVILIDKRNPAFIKSSNNFDRGLIPILLRLVPSNLKGFIKILYIQDVIDKLENYNYHWTNIFCDKYGINK